VRRLRTRLWKWSVFPFFLCLVLLLAFTSSSSSLLADYLEVSGKKLHASCFGCSSCKRPIEGKFKYTEGLFLCAECSRPKCAACQKSISEEYVEVEDKPYHKDCYKK